MIIFSGYGLIIVSAIYALVFFITSTVFKNVDPQFQAASLVGANILATIINYFVAKLLNKNGVKHTAFQIKLETFVIVIGVLLTVLSLFMLKDEF